MIVLESGMVLDIALVMSSSIIDQNLRFSVLTNPLKCTFHVCLSPVTRDPCNTDICCYMIHTEPDIHRLNTFKCSLKALVLQYHKQGFYQCFFCHSNIHYIIIICFRTSFVLGYIF